MDCRVAAAPRNDIGGMDCRVAIAPRNDIGGMDCRVAAAPRNDIGGMDCRVAAAPRNDIGGMDCRVVFAPRNDIGGMDCSCVIAIPLCGRSNPASETDNLVFPSAALRPVFSNSAGFAEAGRAQDLREATFLRLTIFETPSNAAQIDVGFPLS